ncbi:MAG: hypothetical protein ACE5I2_09600 [Anaerolineae bacterium]
MTAIRTGAASGAATDPLARSDSQVVAIFGAGVQSCTQLKAVCIVRPIQTAWIYDPNPEKTEAFIAETVGCGPIPTDLRVAPDHLRRPLGQLLPAVHHDDRVTGVHHQVHVVLDQEDGHPTLKGQPPQSN